MGRNCVNCVVGQTSPFSGQFCPACARLLAEEAYKLYRLTDLQPSDSETKNRQAKAQSLPPNNKETI